MRILHVITGLADGGAEAVLYRLVANDTANTHHVVSLTGEGKYGPLLRQLGVQVTILDMPRGRITPRGLRELWRVVRDTRADVVQSWMYHADLLAGLAGRAAGVPVIWGIRHTTLAPHRSPRTTIWTAKICAALSRRIPAHIVVCAERAREVHAAIGYDVQRMTVVPNGYDVSRLVPDSEARARLRAEWAVPDDFPLIGMVARFDPQKDHSNLVASLARLRDLGERFAAVLVGTGVDCHNGDLVAQLAEANMIDRVRLLGPRHDIPAVMSALDIHVLSSAGEAFPNVLAEAMACGTPCVTTDVGDAAVIVGDTGWVVPPADSAALSAALRAALKAWRERSEWRERQGRARQRVCNAFSIEKMVLSYRSVWAQIAGRG